MRSKSEFGLSGTTPVTSMVGWNRSPLRHTNGAKSTREALREELARRGLSTTLAERPPALRKLDSIAGKPPQAIAPPPTILASENPQKVAIEGVVLLRQFRDLPEALLAKGSLESAGIRCLLGDANMVRMDWFYSNAIGGIKLLVDSDDAAEAEQILSQHIPEHFDVPDVGEYEQPRCPKCDSFDITFRELDPATFFSLALTWLGLGVPMPIHRRAWHCRACHVEWEDDGVPGPSEPTA
jgi:Putative prokaryotic signal transducing protein